MAYINGTQYVTGTKATISDWILGIWNGGASNSNDRLTGQISEFSIERGIWTAADVLSYYNTTKSDYWIS